MAFCAASAGCLGGHHSGIQMAVGLRVVSGFVRTQVEEQQYAGNAQDHEADGANGNLFLMSAHIHADALFQRRLGLFLRLVLAVVL
jgi:hypothetical protein